MKAPYMTTNSFKLICSDNVGVG